MGKKKFNIPEDVSTLDGEALAKSIAEAQEYLSEFDGDSATDEELAEAEAVLGYVSAAEARVQEESAAAEARAQRIAAIKDAAKAKKDDKPAEAKDSKTPEQIAQEEADRAAQAQAAEEAAAVAEAERIAADAGQEAPSREAVVASVAARAAANTNTNKEPIVPEKKTPQSSLVAAAGVPGIEAGTKYENLLEGATVLLNGLNRLPRTAPRDTFVQNAGLLIRLPKNEFSQDNPEYKGRDDFALFNAASKESRLQGGNLAAAGGWGAPSERSLDFCEMESIEGLIQVPEVTITRGGMQYTKGPDFASVLANSTGFWDMTEATAEAGSELKTSLRPSIPPFIEKRLDAVGVMMEAGLLLREGWPELVERYASLLLKAHAYKMAQKTLAQIQALTGAAVSITNGFGNALDFLHVVELVALGERQRLLLSPNQTLEVIAPAWAKAVIRADLAQRSGVDTISVGDSQINSHFTARGVRVQWIQGYQNLVLTNGIATTYPDTLEFIMYPAGTFVRGVTDVITLDTIYDSVNLKKNDYVHLFVEQGVLMANPCGDGRRISLPFVANGRRAGVTDAAATAGQNDSLFNTAVANT
jgi:hypothetical protein